MLQKYKKTELSLINLIMINGPYEKDHVTLTRILLIFFLKKQINHYTILIHIVVSLGIH